MPKKIIKPKPEPKRGIVRILENEKFDEDGGLLDHIEEMAATGAAISTINAKLRLPDGTIQRYLQKGKEQKKGPYRQFYILFRSWVSEAKHAAESTMLKRNPEKWLERSTSAKTIEAEEETELITQSQVNSQPAGLFTPKQLTESLEELRKAGISIDELVDKKKVNIEGPEK